MTVLGHITSFYILTGFGWVCAYSPFAWNSPSPCEDGLPTALLWFFCSWVSRNSYHWNEMGRGGPDVRVTALYPLHGQQVKLSDCCCIALFQFKVWEFPSQRMHVFPYSKAQMCTCNACHPSELCTHNQCEQICFWWINWFHPGLNFIFNVFKC